MGSGSDDTDIKGFNFGPDMVWTKMYGPSGGGYHHHIWDQARGVTKWVMTDTDGAEGTQAEGLQAFNADGFQVGTFIESGYESGKKYVALVWDAGTAAATASTDGSITPSAQWVNATAGFSVSKWTGGGAGNTSTIGHGLGAVPEFFAVKRISADADWIIYHKDLGNAHYLKFNSNGPKVSEATIFSSTSPTNTVITMGTTNMGNNGDFVGYCWTPIPGYSAFGSYIGNNAADGPFVYTGFKPKYLLIKNDTDSGESWVWLDSERDPINPIGQELTVWDTELENNNNLAIFCSNGFKIIDSAKRVNDNNGGVKLLYAAFAEHPFKTARAF